MEVQVRLWHIDSPQAEAGADRTPITPPAMLRQREWVFQHIPVWMRTYNIGRLELALRPAGAVPVTHVSFDMLPGIDDMQEVPAIIRDIRPDIVRMLRILFERMCINSFTLNLSDSELSELKGYWNYLETGVPAVSTPPESAAGGVVHNPLQERDPDLAAPLMEVHVDRPADPEQEGLG